MSTNKVTTRMVDMARPQTKDVFLWDSELAGFGVRVTLGEILYFPVSAWRQGIGFPALYDRPASIAMDSTNGTDKGGAAGKAGCPGGETRLQSAASVGERRPSSASTLASIPSRNGTSSIVGKTGNAFAPCWTITPFQSSAARSSPISNERIWRRSTSASTTYPRSHERCTRHFAKCSIGR